MSDDPAYTHHEDDPAMSAEPDHMPAGLQTKDPTDTDHPTGEQQAQENVATESPS